MKKRRNKQLTDSGSADNRGYDVGYCRPPVAHQFQKGQSGNNCGRPPGQKNLSSILKKIMLEKLTLETSNGRTQTMTRAEVMLRNAATKATTGEPKYIKQLLDLMDKLGVEIQQQPKIRFEVHYVDPKKPPGYVREDIEAERDEHARSRGNDKPVAPTNPLQRESLRPRPRRLVQPRVRRRTY